MPQCPLFWPLYPSVDYFCQRIQNPDMANECLYFQCSGNLAYWEPVCYSWKSSSSLPCLFLPFHWKVWEVRSWWAAFPWCWSLSWLPWRSFCGRKRPPCPFFFYKFNRPALKVVCALHQISHFCKFNHFYRLPLTIVLPAHLTTYFNNNHNPTTTTTVATSALATPTTTRATTAATNDGKP